MKLYIFRHGETYFSKNKLPYGDKVSSAEILPEGVPLIKRLANALSKIPTQINFTSPFTRCLQTVEIVRKITEKEFIIDQRLHDWIPEEESVQNVIERIISFAKDIENKKIERAAICTHGYPINALVSYFTKGYVREPDLDNFPRPGVLVTIDGKEVSYKDFNRA